jgi:hypothetical protein
MPHVRRLLRILVNAATLLSLLLCLAAVVLWVRSRGGSDTFAYMRESTSAGGGDYLRVLSLEWENGGMGICLWRREYAGDPGAPREFVGGWFEHPRDPMYPEAYAGDYVSPYPGAGVVARDRLKHKLIRLRVFK